MFFRRIPAGTFRMGSRGHYEDEEPIHTVAIAQDFYLASFAFTQAQYSAMARACAKQLEEIEGHGGPERSHFKGGFRPVENVNWFEVQVVAQWLSGLLPSLGSGFADWETRLPTEAEWECACRAGTETEFWNGDGEAALEEIGWYGTNSGGETHRVGEKPGNPWGLYDMHGNVFEWCLDLWDAETYRMRQHGVEDPCSSKRDVGEGDRVLRGGSWLGNAGFCRSAYRFRNWPGSRVRLIGFRLALVPGPVKASLAGGREGRAELAGAAKPRRDDESAAKPQAERRG